MLPINEPLKSYLTYVTYCYAFKGDIFSEKNENLKLGSYKGFVECW